MELARQEPRDATGVRQMRSEAQLSESRERFARGFWAKERLDRPAVAVTSPGQWLPMEYLQAPLTEVRLRPTDVSGVARQTDVAYDQAHRRVWCDDWIPYNAPWRAVPWLEAICGCGVHVGGGAMSPLACVDSAAALAGAVLPARADWLASLWQETAQAQQATGAGAYVSPTILRGVSDVLAAMRGLTEFYCDVLTEPGAIGRAAELVNDVLIEVLKGHFSRVGDAGAGYGNVYGYWSPGPTVVLQEDALGMCSPATYAEMFAPLTAAVVAALGEQVLFHLHSTGCGHWREVLAVPALAGLELTLEANGPEPVALEPMLREILEQHRLILFIDGYFEESLALLRRLPREGLYVIVSSRDVPDEGAWRRLLAGMGV